MQRIKIKFWRRRSRSIGSSTSSAAPSVAAAASYDASEGAVDLSVEQQLHCRLCLSDVPKSEMYTMLDCHCSYCIKCCEQYMSVMISEGGFYSITCPDAFCPKGGKFKTSEIERFTDKKTYTRYKRLKFERDVELDPMRTFCPQVGCDTICHMRLHAQPDPDKATPELSSKSISIREARAVCCPTCGHVFCSMCKVKWHGSEQTCDEVMRSARLEDQGIPFDTSVEADVKRCPLCFVPIERNDGCAQMMCKRCKQLFCWYCLESLNDDFLLRHYDKGPCKNKLGHTRASVIWHRAQVVGICTGVGILMLLASPFLLLAAPCILFCKCNASQNGDDDDDLQHQTSTSAREDGFSSS